MVVKLTLSAPSKRYLEHSLPLPSSSVSIPAFSLTSHSQQVEQPLLIAGLAWLFHFFPSVFIVSSIHISSNLPRTYSNPSSLPTSCPSWLASLERMYTLRELFVLGSLSSF